MVTAGFEYSHKNIMVPRLPAVASVGLGGFSRPAAGRKNIWGQAYDCEPHHAALLSDVTATVYGDNVVCSTTFSARLTTIPAEWEAAIATQMRFESV